MQITCAETFDREGFERHKEVIEKLNTVVPETTTVAELMEMLGGELKIILGMNVSGVDVVLMDTAEFVEWTW
jgi:hypothetical protein